MTKILKLILAIFICQASGIVGAFFTANSVNTWYVTLNKPFFNPPSWIFGPVWTILYLMMGVALYLVWDNKAIKLKWFWTQLGLNLLWTILFFGAKNPEIAFVGILFLWFAIFMTIKGFWGANRTAAWLMVPYILWVTFAGILNLSIVLLN